MPGWDSLNQWDFFDMKGTIPLQTKGLTFFNLLWHARCQGGAREERVCGRWEVYVE